MSTKTIRFASTAALLASAGLSLGCFHGPDVQSGLALRRVVIYRNGVGYFEREGKVDEDEVSFKVRTERVGDFLATLAVIEQGGSSVRSASFPVDVQNDDDEADDPGGDGSDPRFDVLLKPPPEKKKPKNRDHLESVKLSLDGKQHDLIVGYVAETPVWRPSYRLVVGKGEPGKPAATADLQAWGIVQNTSGEDWKGVNLTLVAGAPLAFQATLEKAVVPPRPVVTDQGEVISSVPIGETSLANAPPPPPPPAPPPPPGAADPSATLEGLLTEKRDYDEEETRKKESGPKGARASGKAASSHQARRAGGGAAPSPAFAPGPQSYAQPRPAQEYRPNPSPPRNVRALAAVAMEAGATHYALPFTVDVPNNSATMVLLLSKPVPGESIFLFAPDGGVPDSATHPFRVVRYTNDTAGLLERGPIAVFENGAFLGQGMVDPLPRGATATVPFALERSLAVQSARDSNEEGARLAQMEGGCLDHRARLGHAHHATPSRTAPTPRPRCASSTPASTTPASTTPPRAPRTTPAPAPPWCPSRCPRAPPGSSTSTSGACSAGAWTGSLPWRTRRSRATWPTRAPTRPWSRSSAPRGTRAASCG